MRLCGPRLCVRSRLCSPISRSSGCFAACAPRTGTERLRVSSTRQVTFSWQVQHFAAGAAGRAAPRAASSAPSSSSSQASHPERVHHRRRRAFFNSYRLYIFETSVTASCGYMLLYYKSDPYNGASMVKTDPSLECFPMLGGLGVWEVGREGAIMFRSVGRHCSFYASPLLCCTCQASCNPFMHMLRHATASATPSTYMLRNRCSNGTALLRRTCYVTCNPVAPMYMLRNLLSCTCYATAPAMLVLCSFALLRNLHKQQRKYFA